MYGARVVSWENETKRVNIGKNQSSSRMKAKGSSKISAQVQMQINCTLIFEVSPQVYNDAKDPVKRTRFPYIGLAFLV
jgi:hypothetical protein